MTSMSKTIILFFFYLCIAPLSYAQSNIHLEIFQGESIIPYVKDIADLSVRIYKEYPYLYEGTEEEYLPFIEHYTQFNEGIACILFDSAKPIGVAIGMPMNEMREKYKDPFVNARPQESCDEVFYLGEVLLLKAHRGQGLGKKMYLELERKIQENKIMKKVCFCKIDETKRDPLMPNGYKPLDGFWKKLGFHKCEDIRVTVYWCNVNEESESPHEMVYWLKSF
jgi:GNAT superfamily N-acetyltransferase